MKIISYFFLGIEYILCKILSYICVFPLKKKGKGIKKRASAFFYLLFCEKKIIFDNMGNIKGFSGIFWFFTIIFIPIKMKKYGILAILLLVLLCLLNFLSDIYEYRKEFIREKKSVILFWIILPLVFILAFFLS
ncbi:hypothetical protein [Prevotella sp. HJM029]|uniref:hypothetical protein n=1 Tax=Prevotella sp. HJM029 TaxID=1433844 RepID=UPI00048AE8D8|nr:hypothetical protein [Prevotella sp. HJM029]